MFVLSMSDYMFFLLGVSGKKLYSPDAVFDQFFGPDIRTFEEFHTAFLDFYVYEFIQFALFIFLRVN